MSLQVQRSISSVIKHEEEETKASSFANLPTEIRLYILEIFFKFNEQPLHDYKILRLVCKDFKELSYHAIRRVFSSEGMDVVYLNPVLSIGLLEGVRKLQLRNVKEKILEQCQQVFTQDIELKIKCLYAGNTQKTTRHYSPQELLNFKESPEQILHQISRIFPQMTKLNLSNQRGIGLTALDPLSGLNLSHLDLSGTSTNLNALKALSSLKETLTFLNLNGCQLSIDLPEPELLIQKDHVMAFFAQFEKLVSLKIRDWFLKKQDVPELLKLKKLEEIEIGLDLSIDRDSFVEISFLEKLATVLFNLKHWSSSQGFANKFYRAPVWQSVTLVAIKELFSGLKLSDVKIEEIEITNHSI